MPEHPFLNIVMFPGVMLHELSHALACVMTSTRIGKIKIWGYKEAYVTHDTTTPIKNIFISLLPLITGTALGLLFYYLGHVEIAWRTRTIYYWLGASAAVHCFPSTTDATNAITTLATPIKQSLKMKKGILMFLFALITLPITIPILAMLFIIRLLAAVAHLGLAWAIVLFLTTALMVGV